MQNKRMVKRWFYEDFMKGQSELTKDVFWDSYESEGRLKQTLALMNLARQDEVKLEQKRLRKKLVVKHKQRQKETSSRPLYKAGRLAGLMDSLWILGMKTKMVVKGEIKPIKLKGDKKNGRKNNKNTKTV